jgi:uncharacterized DUF497 family protein
MDVFEWDEEKNKINIRKHGIDFRYILNIFNDEHQTLIIDNRTNYNEVREIILGIVESKEKYLFSVVFTRRKNSIRIISARPASKEEKLIYYANY